MSIIDVKEDWRGLGVEMDTESATAPRIFTVKFDAADEPIQRPFLAENAAGIPMLNSAHPYKPWLFVKNKSVDNINLGPFDFKVSVNYTTRSTIGGQEGESQDPTANPLAAPWIVEWDFATSNETINTDIDGKPIMNSAGESYDPPITKDVHDLLLKIQRNEAAFNSIVANNYKNAINSDLFWGFASGLVKCVQFTARTAISGQFWYWQVRYAFQIRLDGWLRRIIDEGYRTKTGELNADGSEKYKEIKDIDGVKLSQPALLNGEGYRLPQSCIDAGSTAFLYFKLNKSLPFSVLGL